MSIKHNIDSQNTLAEGSSEVWFVPVISRLQPDSTILPCKLQPCAVILNERERISMDLHDGIIQSLYALGMHVDLLARSGKLDATQVTPITNGLNDIIDDIRFYIRSLKQSNQRQQNIRQCFEEILARHHARELLEVELDVPERLHPFTPMIFDDVCLIIQEALSNVLRHAAATHLRIAVSQTDHNFRITVTDNGIGFNVDAVQHRGMGLHNLLKRAQLLGGATQIDSAPGQGTCVTIDLSY